MTFTIAKSFSFSASHQLEGLPADHPCSRVHGHNYLVDVELRGTPDPVGFVFDYRALDPVKVWLDAMLDHRHLNDVVWFNPTAEHLAQWLFGELQTQLPGAPIVAIRVHETDRTVAEYRNELGS